MVMTEENNKNTTGTRFSTKDMAMIGLMAAVTCVLAPLAIPIGPVPISLTNLVIYFSLYLIGTRSTFISYVVYLLLGLVGLPVFSGFTGGPGKLAGPTGGYLIGFLLTILIAGAIINHKETGDGSLSPARKKWIDLTGLILGTIVVYAIGTIWLSVQSGIGFKAALLAGVIPFIPGDLVKIILAMTQGPRLKRLIFAR